MAGATRRALAAEGTRTHILETAKALYLERGSKAVLSRELAKRAGVAEGTVFAHFPDKASLLAAALQEDLDGVLAQACARMPAGASCREKMLGLARDLYAYYALRPELSRALLKESLFLSGEWGARVVADVERALALIAGWVAEDKAAGAYAPEADEALAARNLFAAYFSELLMALSLPVFDVDRTLALLDGHLGLVEQGLVPRRESSPSTRRRKP